ncbi:putative oxidoreductase [Flavobacterium sp. ACN2]|uniref:SDR family NAD(P)-dependent oxidoreductase n=1 Tax=unclassified Flavobacterium TaxID=196869 RepID=UPI000BB36E7D|nr:SDR family NAD(P)-dependent oxidoreductase [Flavobacterium sp. ACN2]PBI91796.1 putative oxidoreductase [Flavobacterium sp. ACN2]
MNLFNKAIILITGADGDIGKAFIDELLVQNVSKIYITGLNMEKLSLLASYNSDILFPFILDVTNTEQIKAFCALHKDINILINNAGIELKSDFLNLKAHQYAQLEMNINYVGVVNLTNELLPALKSNSNAAIINILSIASLYIIKRLSTYCASKTATHIFTQAIREDLAQYNIKVFGIYPGYVDSKMSDDVEYDKISPKELVKNICNDINLDKFNIFPDPMSIAFMNSNKLNLDHID